MEGFTRVAATADIPPGEMKSFDVAGEDVAVANVGGEFRAFSNICPHQDTALASGLGAIYGNELVCMLHDSAFDLTTGRTTDGPAAEPLTIYAVRIEGEDLLIGRE